MLLIGNSYGGPVASGSPFTYVIRDLYVMWGQSQLGRSTVSQMTPGQSAQYAGLAPNAFIFTLQTSTQPVFVPMNVGVNTMLWNFNSTDEFGFETSFNYALQQANPAPRYYLKYGVGNTNMFDGWAVGMPLHTQLLNYIEQAVLWGKQNSILFNLKGYCFRQGEGDVDTFAHASPWGQRLIDQFADVTSFFNSMVTKYGIPVFATPVPTVLGRIRDYTNSIQYPGPFSDLVRAATDAYAADTVNNNAASINTDNYPLETDNLHDNPTGEIQCGIDFYNSGVIT